jgi:hypothetical protein
MNATLIATALGDARREGRAWPSRCPLHGGGSLVIRDGKRGRLLVAGGTLVSENEISNANVSAKLRL